MIKKLLGLFTPSSEIENSLKILDIDKDDDVMVKLKVNKIPEGRKFTFHCDKRGIIAELNYKQCYSRTPEQQMEFESLEERSYLLSKIQGDLNQLKKGDLLRIIEAPTSEQQFFEFIPETSFGEAIVMGSETHKNELLNFVNNINTLGPKAILKFNATHTSGQSPKTSGKAIIFEPFISDEGTVSIQMLPSEGPNKIELENDVNDELNKLLNT